MSSGYRNSYDLAFNAEGDLFAYDSDMEWDMGMPWYRPTRAVHATSGSEFGWRSGTGKWPAYYVDSLPPMLNIGPGSPVGVTFGYGAKFPAKYQKALYLCDWTFGTIYALHLEPQGSTYKAVKEEFLSRTPLPLDRRGRRSRRRTLFHDRRPGDAVGTVPRDLHRHRIDRTGRPARAPPGRTARPCGGQSSSFIASKRPDQEIATDVSIRFSSTPTASFATRRGSRSSINRAGLWQERVLNESDPETLITGAVALAHQGDRSLQPPIDRGPRAAQFRHRSTRQQRLELLRAMSLVFIRMGAPDAATAARLATELDPYYPVSSDPLNRELCILLVYLKSPTVVAKTMALLRRPDAAAAESMSDLLARNPGYGGSIAQMLATRPDAQKLHYALRAAQRDRSAGRSTCARSISAFCAAPTNGAAVRASRDS